MIEKILQYGPPVLALVFVVWVFAFLWSLI